MRALSATLLAAQKAKSLHPIVKIVLTQGVNSYTYTRTRIWDVSHKEHPNSTKLEIELDNADKTLTALDFKGYQAVLSFGLTTSAGEEYSDTAPLKVIDQRFNSTSGRLSCILTCIGTKDLMSLDKALSYYQPDSTSTDTVKTILSAVLGGTLAPFTHCTALTVVYDSEDALIDTYVPAAAFRIYKGESRLSVVNRLMRYTGCQWIMQEDGYVHVFVPVISSATLTLRPNGAGDETNITLQTLSGTFHYDKVDEVVADENATMVYTSAIGWERDLYALPNHSSESGTIKSVKVYARCWAFGDPTQASLKIAVKTGGTVYAGEEQTITISWANYSTTWALNPGTGLPWTWAEIDALQAGVSLRQCRTTGIVGQKATYCTQVFVEVTYGVDYEYALSSGYHTFFSKAYQNRLIIPNKVIVTSQADDDPQYSGEATDATSYALIPITKPYYTRLDSDAQGTAIAAAKIAQLQLDAEGGSATVPINVGAELLDFCKVIDAREGDTRTGNIGWIHRHYNAAKGTWEMSFGFGALDSGRSAEDMMNELEADSEVAGAFARLVTKDLYAENIKANQLYIVKHLTDGLAFTDDDPGAGSVSWVEFTLTYDGETYTVVAGNTALKYIWWDLSNPTALQVTDTKPTMGVGDILVAINNSGTARQLINFTLIDGSALYTGSITADEIAARTITAAEIAIGTITADEINLTTITQDDIGDGTQFSRVLSTHLDSNGLKITDAATYQTGYDPSTKRRNFTTTPTTPYDLGDMWHQDGSVKRCTTARASGAYVAGDWTSVDLDDISDTGTTFARTLSTHLEAGKLKLTDQAVFDGEWYTESGVVLDASCGVSLYGDDIALRTFANVTAYNTWKAIEDINSITGVQCYIGTGGQIFAGAGAVWLDSTGLHVEGSRLYFTWGGSASGVIGSASASDFTIGGGAGRSVWIMAAYENPVYLSSGAGIHLQALANISINQPIVPSTDNTKSVGTSSVKFNAGHFTDLTSYSNLYCVTLTATGLATTHSIVPSASNTYTLGASSQYWSNLYAYTVSYHTLTAFDAYDDIALLKAIKTTTKTDKDGNCMAVLDIDTFPEGAKHTETTESGEKVSFFDAGGVAGLALCTSKRLLDRIELLEDRLMKLEEGRKS